METNLFTLIKLKSFMIYYLDYFLWKEIFQPKTQYSQTKYITYHFQQTSLEQVLTESKIFSLENLFELYAFILFVLVIGRHGLLDYFLGISSKS